MKVKSSIKISKLTTLHLMLAVKNTIMAHTMSTKSWLLIVIQTNHCLKKKTLKILISLMNEKNEICDMCALKFWICTLTKLDMKIQELKKDLKMKERQCSI